MYVLHLFNLVFRALLMVCMKLHLKVFTLAVILRSVAVPYSLLKLLFTVFLVLLLVCMKAHVSDLRIRELMIRVNWHPAPTLLAHQLTPLVHKQAITVMKAPLQFNHFALLIWAVK